MGAVSDKQIYDVYVDYCKLSRNSSGGDRDGKFFENVCVKLSQRLHVPVVRVADAVYAGYAAEHDMSVEDARDVFDKSKRMDAARIVAADRYVADMDALVIEFQRRSGGEPLSDVLMGEYMSRREFLGDAYRATIENA